VTFLTPKEGTDADTTTADSDSTDSEADCTADYDADSESELWEPFDFPQLTPQEDAQLTIALQGGCTPRPTTSVKTSTTMGHHEATDNSSRICFGVQGRTAQGPSETSASGPSSSPPPYMLESRENNPLQSANRIFLINNDSVFPISSTDRQFCVVVDGVYHIIKQN